MCIGCRGRAPQAELVRTVAVAVDDGAVRVVADAARRMPGRGAWVHPRSECVANAVRRQAFRRALRLQGPVAVDEAALLGAAPD